MNIRFQRQPALALLAIALLLLAACGTFEVDLEQELAVTALAAATVVEKPTEATTTPQPAPSPTWTSAPELEVPATESPEVQVAPSPLWATYRDPASGFGYAFPCHWVSQGTTLASYDEAYFLDRSVRGQWADGNPPEGAVKLEIAAFDYDDSGIAPGTPLEEAVPLAISDTIVSTERVALGDKEALQVQLEGTIYPDDSSNEIYFFQASPTSMLLFSVSPRGALASPDIQNVVDSLALSAGEQIVIPAADPQGALEDRAVFADAAAGYCFQYPSDYTQESFPPSGVPYAGDIATLKLERPFYTLGLTSTALPVGEQSVLEELVTQFIQGLPEDTASQVERNPSERVGGVDFQLGRLPAEFLEGVPGAGGSRDIFGKYEDRLYRLSFIPSTSSNPQAAPDLEALFLVVTTSFSFLPLQN